MRKRFSSCAMCHWRFTLSGWPRSHALAFGGSKRSTWSFSSKRNDFADKKLGEKNARCGGRIATCSRSTAQHSAKQCDREQTKLSLCQCHCSQVTYPLHYWAPKDSLPLHVFFNRNRFEWHLLVAHWLTHLGTPQSLIWAWCPDLWLEEIFKNVTSGVGGSDGAIRW